MANCSVFLLIIVLFISFTTAKYVDGTIICGDVAKCNTFYFEWSNGKKIAKQLPYGHVCIKNKIIDVSSNTKGYKLIDCDGLSCEVEGAVKCEQECTANKGYLICKNKRWEHHPLKESEICGINPKTKELHIESLCDPTNQSVCANRIYGNEKCSMFLQQQRCVAGEKTCENQCNCGSGYYVCNAGKWSPSVIAVPEGKVCQNEERNGYHSVSFVDASKSCKDKKSCSLKDGKCSCLN